MCPSSDALDRFRPEVEAELQACLADDARAPGLYDMLRYHFGWLDANLRPSSRPGGKLLRPTLCLLAAEAVGADYRRALPGAAALELLHNFSLIHDDIQDRSDERHHRATVWRLWGDAQGIDAGDAALVLAELSLLRAVERGVAPSVVLAGLRLLNLACLRLAEGQHLDIGFAGKLDVTAEQYFAMVSGKTAALLGCSLELGALLGSGDAALARRYGAVGEELGLAFQVQDDLLGIWGEQKRTGKPVGSDVYERKMTLPVVYALAHSSPSSRDELAAIYGSASVTERQAARAVEILEASGARAHADEVAQRHYRAALDGLSALRPAEPAATALREIAAFLASRDY